MSSGWNSRGSGAAFKPLTDPAYTDGDWNMELTRIAPGGSSPPHKEPWAHLFYVLSGSGDIEIEGERAEMGPGTVHPVAAGRRHSLRNTGDADLMMLAVYHPARARSLSGRDG